MPDIEKMQEAAFYLEGRHDFASFCTNPKMKKSTVRVVDKIQITSRKDNFKEIYDLKSNNNQII